LNISTGIGEIISIGIGDFIIKKGIDLMIFAISLSLCLLVLIFSVVKLQKLHLFEIVFILIIITFLHQNFTFVVTVNLDLWKKPEQVNQTYGLIASRIIGTPFLAIWFFELYTMYRSPLGRTALFLLFASLLAGVDYLMNYAKLIHIVTWSFWSSFATWLVIFSVTLLLLLWYRTILKKEVLL
jgi:hypothetical protein